MDSDSDDLSTPANIPADAVIEQCLRRTIRDAVKADEEVSVNKARARAEKTLGLDADFLKNNALWKARSKDIIRNSIDEPGSPEKPKKAAPKPKAKPAAKAGSKRKSDEAQPRKKRQKKSVTPESEEDEVASPPEPKSNGTRSKAPVSESEGEPELQKPSAQVQAKDTEESALSEPAEDVEDGDASKPNGKPVADDESDMSSVLDDPPPAKKKRQKKSTSPSDTKDTVKKAAKPAKAGKELSPDEEEIKRLQGWLVKCGVRKVWGRELAKFDVPKQKIKHLKGLLDEVGMTGRYSTEKAKQIKESRELAAEIEAAKEFNQQWGEKGSDEEEEEEEAEKRDAKPRRLRPKGLVDFGDSGDDSG